jgi:hypothetical protein
MTFSLFQQRSLFLGPTHLKGGVIDDSATACGARSLGRVYQPPEMPANSWCSALELHLTTIEEEEALESPSSVMMSEHLSRVPDEWLRYGS